MEEFSSRQHYSTINQVTVLGAEHLVLKMLQQALADPLTGMLWLGFLCWVRSWRRRGSAFAEHQIAEYTGLCYSFL